MEGDGLASTLTLKAFKTLANQYRKTIKGSRPLMDGELHYMGSNFLGPGTRMDIAKIANARPINRPDAIAKTHDSDYLRISKMNISADKKKELIRKADKDFIKSMKDLGKLGEDEEGYRQAGLKGIQFKKKVENVSPSLAGLLLPKDLLGKKISGKGIMNRDTYVSPKRFLKALPFFQKNHGLTKKEAVAMWKKLSRNQQKSYLDRMEASEKKGGDCRPASKAMLDRLGISSKKDFLKWSRDGGHPDKGGDTETYQKVQCWVDIQAGKDRPSKEFEEPKSKDKDEEREARFKKQYDDYQKEQKEPKKKEFDDEEELGKKVKTEKDLSNLEKGLVAGATSLVIGGVVWGAKKLNDWFKKKKKDKKKGKKKQKGGCACQDGGDINDLKKELSHLVEQIKRAYTEQKVEQGFNIGRATERIEELKKLIDEHNMGVKDIVGDFIGKHPAGIATAYATQSGEEMKQKMLQGGLYEADDLHMATPKHDGNTTIQQILPQYSTHKFFGGSVKYDGMKRRPIARGDIKSMINAGRQIKRNIKRQPARRQKNNIM